MNLAHFEIKKSIKEVLKILEQKANAKNIIVELDFENLIFEMILHDEKRI